VDYEVDSLIIEAQENNMGALRGVVIIIVTTLCLKKPDQDIF